MKYPASSEMLTFIDSNEKYLMMSSMKANAMSLTSYTSIFKQPEVMDENVDEHVADDAAFLRSKFEGTTYQLQKIAFLQSSYYGTDQVLHLDAKKHQNFISVLMPLNCALRVRSPIQMLSTIF